MLYLTRVTHRAHETVLSVVWDEGGRREVIYNSNSHLLKVENQQAISKAEVQKEKYRDEHSLQIRRQVPDTQHSSRHWNQLCFSPCDFSSSNYMHVMLCFKSENEQTSQQEGSMLTPRKLIPPIAPFVSFQLHSSPCHPSTRCL